MKIWDGYGSEHSSNLVMIGHFQSAEAAKATEKVINQLAAGLKDKIDIGTSQDRFSDEVMNLLKEAECYNFSPLELEQFLYEVNVKLEGSKIIFTTEEVDVSAFFKLMILKGAKVEIYSAHDYPEAGNGRGK